MKKLVLVLVVALVVAPSFGALSLTLTKTDNIVTLGYADANTANLPRAFALNVAVSGTGTVIDVNNFIVGESTSSNRGFGIYPATIDINGVTGNVVAWGTPLAATGDPGAGDQVMPSNSFVVEFGSLYVGTANEPAASGTLCKFNVDTDGADVTVSVDEEDTYRGGVVLEDGTVPATELTASIVVEGGCSPMPVAATTPTPANGAIGVTVKLLPAAAKVFPALSWTPAAGGANAKYDVYFGTVNPPVTVVSANQTTTSYSATGALEGKTYYWKVVSKNDCDAVGVSSDVWTFNTDCYKSTSTAYAAWVTFGKPACWCYQRNCRGDADGIKTGAAWVAGPDLTVLKSALGKTDTQLLAITNGICADFDRVKTGAARVAGPDLTRMKGYIGKTETNVPVCDVATVNFWTN